jgi:hypothetical protein
MRSPIPKRDVDEWGTPLPLPTQEHLEIRRAERAQERKAQQRLRMAREMAGVSPNRSGSPSKAG